jgi:hypothetical protein
VYRAIDQFGQVIDVFVSSRRNTTAARRFFERAIGTTRVTPVEVVTDQAATYPTVLEELLPAAWHRTDQYPNNRIEADHGRLKSRLRPMRGLKQDRNASVIIGGHAFVQNVRRGHTSWRSRSWRTGGWRSRSTSRPWRSGLGVASRLHPCTGLPQCNSADECHPDEPTLEASRHVERVVLGRDGNVPCLGGLSCAVDAMTRDSIPRLSDRSVTDAA